MTTVLRLSPHFYWPQLAASGWPVKMDAIGGMQSQIFDLVNELATRGLDQTVLTLKIPGAPSEWAIDARTRVIGVRIPILPLRSRLRGMVDLNMSWALGALAYIRRFRVTADIIHVHLSGVLEPPLLGILLARMLNRPLVLTVHCSSLATYHAMSRLDRVQHAAARFIETRALAAAAGIVVLTPRLKEALLERFPDLADRIRVVPDALDVAGFSARASDAAREAFRVECGLRERRHIVGYVGRIAREKNWRALLQLAHLLPSTDVHFLVVGDGNERDLFDAELVRQGLRSRFTVTGYLARDRIPAALAACDVLVLPSRHEEFGSVLIEAMAAGTPAVAFKTGGIPYVLDHGRAGRLVADGSARDMAEEIQMLLDSPDRRAHLVEIGRRRVAEHFDIGCAARSIAALYEEVLLQPCEHRRPRPIGVLDPAVISGRESPR